MTTGNLKNKTAKGLLWGGFGAVMLQFMSLVFGIFLARLLNAEDYGIVGLLAIFSQLAATFCESGFTKALVNRPGLRHKDYNAVFWFSLAMGVVCYVVLFFCAPLIARFYNEPRLTALSRYAFLYVLFSCLSVVPLAYMLKTLMVKQRTLVMWICLAVSNIVGIFLAFRGFAHWGIVTQNLIYSALNMVLCYVYSGWRPTLGFSMKPLREMFSYSVKLLGTAVLTIVNNNLFTIFLAKFFSVKLVGNYNQANKWSTMGYSLVATTIANVTQPVLASIDVVAERERYYAAFRKLVRFTAFVVFPIMFGLAFIAREFIVILITDKWLRSAEMLSILAVGHAFFVMTRVFSDVLAERGRSDRYLLVSAVSGGLQILSLFLLHPFGIRVMLLSGVIIQLLAFFFWYFYVWKEVGYRLWHLVGDVFSYAGIASIALGIAYLLLIWMGVTNIYLSIVLKVLMVSALYMGGLYITKSVMLRESCQYMKGILHSVWNRCGRGKEKLS
ncbi:MAG: lipopolysaccharide biosynthesis protein [Bacteroides sp.]|nr:lipopolysaccharide biosynthesis protein [Ruminococcus flavefaciens]MCM1554537.1 lipopolysaccharide biosynthesis protein [Bacteroides sp.]